MKLEVAELSSIELSGLGRLVARETQAGEEDGSKKAAFVVSLESAKRYVDIGLRSGTLAFWIGIGHLWSRCVGKSKENTCQDLEVSYWILGLLSGNWQSGKGRRCG